MCHVLFVKVPFFFHNFAAEHKRALRKHFSSETRYDDRFCRFSSNLLSFCLFPRRSFVLKAISGPRIKNHARLRRSYLKKGRGLALPQSLSPCFPSSVIALFEHVGSFRIQHPVRPCKNSPFLQLEGVEELIFTFPPALSSPLNLLPRDFYKTIIQTQIMSDGVLPALLILPVVGEVVHYKPGSTAHSKFKFTTPKKGANLYIPDKVKRCLGLEEIAIAIRAI